MSNKQIRGFKFIYTKPKKIRQRRGFSFIVQQWKINKFQSQLFSQNDSLQQSSITVASQEVSNNTSYLTTKKIRGFSFIRK